MLLSKHAIETAAVFAGDHDARMILNGIHLEADGQLVATDGHLLGIISPAVMPASEYPAFPGRPAEEPALEPCTIPADELLKASKAVPKPRRFNSFPILQHVYVNTAASNPNGSATFHTTDLETVQTITAKKLEGKFPTYQQVIPKTEPVYRVCLDAVLLERVAKAAKKLKAGKTPAPIELEFHANHLGPVAFEVKGTEQTLTGLIMPMRGRREKEEYGLQEPAVRKALAPKMKD